MLTLCVLSAALSVANQQITPYTSDQTESPHMVIEGGERGVDRFPLLSTDVTASITGTIAEVTVRQTYRNDGDRPLHVRYVFPGSTRAAIHGLTLTVDERVVRAQIQERQQAQRTFQKAQREGKTASLLEQKRPNVFSMRLANVLAGDIIDVELSYTELLVPTDGIYEFVYPTVVGPRYGGGDHEPDDWVSNPYLPEGSASPATLAMNLALSTALPLHDLACPTHDVSVTWDGLRSARIALSPEETRSANRDLILRYRLGGTGIESGLTLYEGDDENTFSLMVQPPQRVSPADIPPREYLFVMDVSGSMDGFPLAISKTLLSDLIRDLRPVDLFNVVLFAGASTTLSPVSLTATDINLGRALHIIDRQTGGGGTELAAALDTALAIPTTEGVARSVVVVTDGFVSAEARCFTTIVRALENASVFAFGIGSSVNRYLIEGLARAGQGEAFVVTEQKQARSVSQRFREYISAPVLTNIRIVTDGWEVYDLEPTVIADMLAQRPVLVTGKWRGERTGSIAVTGNAGSGSWSQSFNPGQHESRPEHKSLPLLWARQRIARLADWNFGSPGQEQIRRVTSLGLTYNLLTRWTSFVAVDDVVRNPKGQAQDVTQPLPLPKGVPNTAVGGGSGDEPEVWLIAVLAALALALRGMFWALATIRRRRFT